jgi:Zn-finger nucleic acid-binding protein
MFLFVAAQGIAALFMKNTFPSGIRNSRRLHKVFNGQVNYDPFESDRNIRDMVMSELLIIKRLNSTSIKMELTTLGLPSKGFVDKSELEKILARERVKNKIRLFQVKEQSRKDQQRRAELIDDEIWRIKSSGISELSMTKELHSMNIKFNVSGELAYQLALARLNISVGPETKDSAETEMKDSESTEMKIFGETVTDLKGIYSRFVENVESLIPEVTANITSIASQQLISEKMRTAQEYVRNIGLTKLEQQAQTMTSATGPDSAGSSTDASIRIKATALSESEITDALAAASNLASFDDVMRWAKNKTRNELAQFLRYRNEDVPTYAPRSALAAILADSLLVDKTNSGTNDFAEVDNFGRNFVSKEEPSGASRAVETFDASRITARQPNSRKMREDDARSNRKSNYRSSREMTSFFFERELLGKFSIFFSDIIKSVVSKETFNGITTGTTGTQFTRFMSRLITLGCKASLTAAYWAGGEAILPSHVIFIAAAYSILFSKGIWSFFASFIIVRIIREIAFFRESFSEPSGAAPATA